MFFLFRRQPADATPLSHTETPCPQRRRLLKGMAGAAALVAVPDLAQAMARLPENARALAFRHTHTGESLSLVYRVGDRYVTEGMQRLAHLMRDFRSGDVHPVDPALLDTLWQLQQNLHSKAPFEIISAYRSPKTNAMLRGRSSSSGVAKKSMHMTGQAIDIRLPGTPLAHVRDAAIDIRRGGVGYYASSDFVHLDTGRVRRW